MPPPLYFLCGDVMKKGIKKRLAALLLSVLVLVALFEYVCIHSAVAASGIAIIGLTTAIGLISVYLGYVGSCNENGWTDQTIIDTWRESWLGSGQMFDDWAVGWDEIKDSYKQAFLNEVWGNTYSPEDLANYDVSQTITSIPEGILYNCDGVVRSSFVSGNVSNVAWSFPSGSYPCIVTHYVGNNNLNYKYHVLYRIGDVCYSRILLNNNTFSSNVNGLWNGTSSYFQLSDSVSNYTLTTNDSGVNSIFDNLGIVSFENENQVIQVLLGSGSWEDVSIGGGGEYAPKFAYPAAQDLANNEDYLGGIRLDGLPSEQDLMNGVNAVGAASADDFLVGLHSGVYGPSDVYTAMQASGVTPYVLTDAGTGEVIGVGENAGSVAAGQEGVKPVALDSSLALPTAAQALAAPEYQPQNWDLVNPGQFQFPLFDFFPWCIPKDLYLLLSLFLVAEPVTPVFTIPFPVSENQTQDITFDFSDYDEIARVGRNIFIVFFIAGLIITIKNRMF